ncbi:lipid-A-disaccharide synthase [Thermotomaculum hydrothermale]|uniref:Lipid-A-disaccharide synthase n=1 Tax=Thermotomaculum hydrothermale TaxID=981385 RepID=A0A7R6PHH1_9BACT|nr:lipid-A-disaccharide synthase [Thermotomaculum hydrothermale]BBB32679.1 lipid-A-disaccharide synthase [Thermotomaculum hydrothermale]
MNKKIFILCGELSAEQYAAKLVPFFKKQGYEVYALGGNLLKKSGANVVLDYKALSVVGLTEVIEHYSHLKKAFNLLVEKIKELKPDILICIDFPDFNIRLAKKVKKYVGKLVYFIPPQVWAWRLYRAKFISNLFDRVIVLFPFEKPLYENARYYGHPLTEMIEVKSSENEFEKKYSLESDKKRVLLLPGSRKKEVISLTPHMTDFATLILQKHNDIDFLFLPSPSLEREVINLFKAEFTKETSTQLYEIQPQDKYEAIKYSDIAIGSSGTVSLECGLLKTPMAALYKLSNLTYFFGLCVVRSDFITIPNIILEEEVFKELINFTLTPENIMDYTEKVLYNPEFSEALKKKLDKLGTMLHKDKILENITKEIMD